jgi:hypothetical protein
MEPWLPSASCKTVLALLAAVQVMPKTFGQTLPPWFFLLPSYWTGASKDTISKDRPTEPPTAGTSSAKAISKQLHQGKATGFTNDASAYVEVVGLGKTYESPDGSSRVAVQGLNMQLAAGRVAALLGRNGAGKSTVMHMLTGEGLWLLSPVCFSADMTGFLAYLLPTPSLCLRAAMAELKLAVYCTISEASHLTACTK